MQISDDVFPDDYIELAEQKEGLLITMYNDNFLNDVDCELFITDINKAKAIKQYLEDYIEEQETSNE